MPPRPKHVIAHLYWSTAQLEYGMRAYAREAGWTFAIAINPAEHLSGSRKVDGVLLNAIHYPIDVRKLYPVAKIVDIRGIEMHDVDARLRLDHRKIAHLAADHLYGLGYRRFIGFGSKRVPVITQRLDAFKERLEELGGTADLLYIDFWHQHIVLAPSHLKGKLRAIFKKLAPPLAVFAPDDDIAAAFIMVALEMGYRIPEDFAVLGANNNRAVCETCPVPISSVDPDHSRRGYEAARMLDELMKGNVDFPRELVIPPRDIKIRASTVVSNDTDRIVTPIAEYIREHFAEKITPAIVLQDLHLSRTVGFVRFKKATGRSIGQEITKARMESACHLLTQTDFKIDAVARMCGYESTSAFCRLFRRLKHDSPAAFRKKSPAPDLVD